MNYILLINNFWRQHHEQPFSPNAQLLYMHLLRETNSRNWQQPLPISTTLMSATIGYSEHRVVKARQELAARSMITFTEGDKYRHPSYALTEPDNSCYATQESPQPTCPAPSRPPSQPPSQPSSRPPKQRTYLNNKQINKSIIPPTPIFLGGEESQLSHARHINPHTRHRSGAAYASHAYSQRQADREARNAFLDHGLDSILNDFEMSHQPASHTP